MNKVEGWSSIIIYFLPYENISRVLQTDRYQICPYFRLCKELVTTGLGYSSYQECYSDILIEGYGEKGEQDIVKGFHVYRKNIYIHLTLSLF